MLQESLRGRRTNRKRDEMVSIQFLQKRVLVAERYTTGPIVKTDGGHIGNGPSIHRKVWYVV